MENFPDLPNQRKEKETMKNPETLVLISLVSESIEEARNKFRKNPEAQSVQIFTNIKADISSKEEAIKILKGTLGVLTKDTNLTGNLISKFKKQYPDNS